MSENLLKRLFLKYRGFKLLQSHSKLLNLGSLYNWADSLLYESSLQYDSKCFRYLCCDWNIFIDLFEGVFIIIEKNIWRWRKGHQHFYILSRNLVFYSNLNQHYLLFICDMFVLVCKEEKLISRQTNKVFEFEKWPKN